MNSGRWNKHENVSRDSSLQKNLSQIIILTKCGQEEEEEAEASLDRSVRIRV